MALTFDSKWILVTVFSFIISGCGDSTSEQQLVQQAVPIEHGDECYLDGMFIKDFPGPKGELYERGNKLILKFCSTGDMFAYMLDPEHKHAIQTVYVHDMAMSPWDNPDDTFFIDARQAWYVVGSARKGAMGPTLASFLDKTAANSFAKQYGGKVYRFEDINQAVLRQMK